MQNERHSATIIPFPIRGSPRKLEPSPSGSETETVPFTDWPPMALDDLDISGREPVPWLEEALVAAKVRELAFLRGLSRLPPTFLRPEMRDGPLVRFLQVGHRLTLTLELLRLGQVEPDEVRVLLPGLGRAWRVLRSLRQSLLEDMESRARELVQGDEFRGRVGPADVELALQERSRARTLERDYFQRRLAVPGTYPLPVADQPHLELRRRRALRLAQDNRPVNVEMDLAGWLEVLPQEWLEGIARGLGLSMFDDRWEEEQAIASRLTDRRRLVLVVRKLPALERTILARVLQNGGVLRYDELVLRYGADEETAWHWAEEVPTTPLERVRRSGLLYAGQCQLGRKAHRVAVVPTDIRETLRRLIEACVL